MRLVLMPGGGPTHARDAARMSRLARSAGCRSWYRWRRRARDSGLPPPIWVIVSPPWPVVRLGRRLAGKSVALAALSYPFSLLAGGDDDVVEDGFWRGRGLVRAAKDARAASPLADAAR